LTVLIVFVVGMYKLWKNYGNGEAKWKFVRLMSIL
jgi:hypothetical protein